MTPSAMRAPGAWSTSCAMVSSASVPVHTCLPHSSVHARTMPALPCAQEKTLSGGGQCRHGPLGRGAPLWQGRDAWQDVTLGKARAPSGLVHTTVSCASFLARCDKMLPSFFELLTPLSLRGVGGFQRRPSRHGCSAHVRVAARACVWREEGGEKATRRTVSAGSRPRYESAPRCSRPASPTGSYSAAPLLSASYFFLDHLPRARGCACLCLPRRQYGSPQWHSRLYSLYCTAIPSTEL